MDQIYKISDDIHDVISPKRLMHQDLIKDTYLCSICKNILSLNGSKTCSIEKCGELVCKNCISFDCPKLGCDSSSHIGNLPRVTREELERLEVKCKYKGCNKYIRMLDLKNHENMCELSRKNCEFCNNIFDSNSIEQHYINCAQRSQKCAECSFQGKFNKMQHDCQIYQRVDMMDKKLEEKRLQIDQMLEEIQKSLNLKGLQKNKKRLILKAYKKRNKKRNSRNLDNNSNKIEDNLLYESIIITKNFSCGKIGSEKYHSKSKITAITEMKNTEFLLIGFNDGKVRPYKENITLDSNFFKHNNEDEVTYILDLKTSDFKFITAGKDKQLIIRKFIPDKNHKADMSGDEEIQKIKQEFYSTYLEKTNRDDRIISSDEDYNLRIWDIIKLNLFKIIELGSNYSIDRFKHNKSGNFFLLSRNCNIIELYDVDNCKTKKEMVNENKIKFIMYYEDQYFLTFDEENSISLWDFANSCRLDKYKFNGQGHIDFMFIVKTITLAFITTDREIYFLILSKNIIVEFFHRRLLSKISSPQKIYYNEYNKILAIHKMNSAHLHLFKFF